MFKNFAFLVWGVPNQYVFNGLLRAQIWIVLMQHTFVKTAFADNSYMINQIFFIIGMNGHHCDVSLVLAEQLIIFQPLL